MKIVLASNNKGKLREFNRLLSPLNVEVHPQGEFNIPAADEPYGTFLENCLAKARHAAKLTGLPRFAGEPGDDQRNNALLVEKLKGVSDRGAHYTCVLVAVRSAEDPEPIIAEGRWYGEVIDSPRGEGGFGYDPYFLLPQVEKTAAELTADEKNAVSHRGIAMVKLIDEMKKRWPL